jgi:hypothetical protein
VAEVPQDGVTEFVVEIVDGSEPVRGHVGLRDGQGADFSGWSEFAATLERFRLADAQSAQVAGSGADERMLSTDTRADTMSTAGPSRKMTNNVPGPMAAPSSHPASAPPPCSTE